MEHPLRRTLVRSEHNSTFIEAKIEAGSIHSASLRGTKKSPGKTYKDCEERTTRDCFGGLAMTNHNPNVQVSDTRDDE